MTIYIDSDYKCYTDSAVGRTAVETDAFDGKCKRYIEGYRYVPEGSAWARPDGVTFPGPMVTPFVSWPLLQAYQNAYETEADMRTALETMGVNE